MTILIVGASGKTGKHVVEELLQMKQHVKILVRFSSKIPDSWNENNNVTVIRAEITKMTVNEIADIIKDCQAIVSCLGHSLSIKGIWGKPHKLVTNVVELLCNAVEMNSSDNVMKFILMNSTGCRDKNLHEPISFGENITMKIIRLLAPPHSDNEKASEFLRLNIGQNNIKMQWVIIRPDTLIDENSVTDYELYTSPTRSPLFNPGKTSRINTGHFMAKLIVDNNLWKKWQGKMPVIYNK